MVSGTGGFAFDDTVGVYHTSRKLTKVKMCAYICTYMEPP